MRQLTEKLFFIAGLAVAAGVILFYGHQSFSFSYESINDYAKLVQALEPISLSSAQDKNIEKQGKVLSVSEKQEQSENISNTQISKIASQTAAKTEQPRFSAHPVAAKKQEIIDNNKPNPIVQPHDAALPDIAVEDDKPTEMPTKTEQQSAIPSPAPIDAPHDIVLSYGPAVLDAPNPIPYSLAPIAAEEAVEDDEPAAMSAQTEQQPVSPPPPPIAAEEKDIIPPETTIISAPSAIGSSTDAVFSFVSNETNAVFECELDNAGWNTCFSPHVLANFADASHNMKIRAIDSAGNIDPLPAETNWIVDATSPIVSIMSDVLQISSSTSANFQIYSNEIQGIIFACQLDMNPWQQCSTSTAISDLAQGNHIMEAKAYDMAGNMSSSTAVSWLVDTISPESSVINLNPYFQIPEFFVQWSGTDTASSATTSILAYFDVQYKIDNAQWQDWITASTSTNAMFGASTTLGQMVYFRSRAVDFAGNIENWPENNNGDGGAENAVPILPAAITDLLIAHASTTANSVLLAWTSPADGKLNENAYYAIKYEQKSGDCALQSNWSGAISVASSSLPVQEQSSGISQTAEITGLSEDTEYCFAVKTYNGAYWSDLSNQASEQTATAQHPIVLGNTSFAFSNWKSSFSWKHTVNGGNPVLIVSLHSDNGWTPNSVTYNDQPLTLKIKKFEQNSYAVSIYYLANPPQGEHDLKVNIGSQTRIFAASAATFLNCDTDNPIGLTAASHQAAKTMTQSVNTNINGMMLIDAVTYDKYVSIPISVGAGQTQYFSQHETALDGAWYSLVIDLYAGQSYKLAEQAGAHSMSWIMDSERRASHVIIGLNPKQ